jgi:UDP-glucose 4-epimerase
VKAFISGSCGFLGSALVDRLVADGHSVIGADNMRTGFYRHTNPGADYQYFDILDYPRLCQAMRGVDTVYHLAANADISGNWGQPTLCIQQNVIATSNILEAMRANGIKRIAFASSSAVYGDSATSLTPEDCPWPTQTSLYGASKVAGEALVSAYCAGQGFEGYIFRFSPVVGERYTHGHIFDFVKQLTADPTKLKVKSNGLTRKPYVYVGDVVEAMLHVMRLPATYPQIYNITNPDVVALRESITWICSAMNVSPEITYGAADIGWSGDMPVLWPSPEKLMATGWAPSVTSEEGIRRTVRWLMGNSWALEGR